MSSFSTFSFDKSALRRLPARPQRSNKGTFGRVLLICGSRGMAGAAYLSAKAALRTGAGLVEVFTPECNREIIQSLLPEAIVTAYSEESPSRELTDAALARADAIVCGCGLGQSAASRALLSHVLRAATIPCVIDADGLNLVSRNPSLKKYLSGKIITPHPGEMSRLCGKDTEEICSRINSVCQDFAREWGLVCVLKDHSTAVSDGSERLYVNNSGNSGMATAGSGDVLAGVIGSILAQNQRGELSAFDVACLGVYIHGLSGDSAAAQIGEYSLIASDIIDHLPMVLKGIQR